MRPSLAAGAVLALLILFTIFSASVSAHSGRTDSKGGHNCYVAPCAGEYHYHNSGSSVNQSKGDSTIFESTWFWIFVVGGGVWIVNKKSK